MQIESIDHFVLTVKSLEETCIFYKKIFGMEVKKFGNERIALHFGTQKINLHQIDTPIDANVKHATPGSADLCFVTKLTISEIVQDLNRKNIKIIEGDGLRTGAVGRIRSVYVYDPDENLIEIATYNF